MGGEFSFVYFILEVAEHNSLECAWMLKQDKKIKIKGERSWIYTQSSIDISNGLTYSKPSNSDWSIVLIAFISSGVS